MRLYKPTLFEPDGPLRDQQIYICDTLIKSRIFNRAVMDDDWIRLSSRALRDVLGEVNYHHTRKHMIESGIIECNESYHAPKNGTKGRCKGYRLCEPYSDCKWHEVQISNARIIRHLERVASERKKPTRRIERHLERLLHQLTIEYDGPELEKPEYQIMVNLIRDKTFFFHRDDYGRIHTNMTNLWKELRQYLRHNGQALVNVDISNSQPLFLGLTLREYVRSAENINFLGLPSTLTT